jgi:hypothetical protein
MLIESCHSQENSYENMKLIGLQNNDLITSAVKITISTME